MKNNLSKIFLFTFIGAFMAISLILPLFSLFIKAFQNNTNEFIGLANFIEYFNNPNTASSLTHSLTASFTITALVLLLAFFFAYGVTRTNIKGKGLLKFIAFLPLFAPTMTHGIGLIYLFGRQGIFTRTFGIELPIYGLLGIVLAEIIFIFPILFLMLSLALKHEDYRKYEVAELMGISKLRQFFTITLPNIKYTVITSIFTAFTLSFTDFGAPKVIGGNYNILATDIFKQVIGQQNFSMGSTVGILLIIPAFIAFLADLFISAKNRKNQNGATTYQVKNNLSRDIFFSIFNYVIAIMIMILFSIILIASLVKSWPYDMSLSFRAYNFTVMGESVWTILANSIFVAFISAITGTIICFFTAYMIERQKEYAIVRKTGYFLSILPNAVPGLTIGLSYIFFFNASANPLNFLYGTFAIIIIANIVHFFATPFLTITAALKKLDSEYESISNIMGVPWYKTVFKVIMPLSMNAILESFAYYFVNSMITISAVIFLYTSNTRLMSIMMISKNDAGEIASAAAMAIIILLVNILFKVIFDYLIKYLRKRSFNKKHKEALIKQKQGERLRQKGKEILQILNKASQNSQVKYWLEFGTLLGKIRENNFIGSDVNFDIGVMQDELSPKFLIDLEEQGFKRITTLSIENEGLQYIQYDYQGIEVELFIFIRDKQQNKVLSYSKGIDQQIYYYRLSDTHLKEVQFMGIDTFIPRNSIKRLLEIYGNHFNIKNTNWQDEMSPSRFISNKVEER